MATRKSISRRAMLKLGAGALAGAVGLKATGGRSLGKSWAEARVRDLPSEPWKMGATDLAAAIRAKDLSCREVVQAHLDRIAVVNGKLNAVTVVLEEDALAAADLADKALTRGEDVGPLHGVPMTVKENIDLAGTATTNGVVAFKDAIPSVDAPQIAQLKRAGAIPIGRTNLPDFGMRWHTDNALHGATKNPWDAGRTPGGSSGGEAAALATGMSPLGNGNDYGGSLRFPAQCCGITSIRPSRGRVPYASALQPAEAPITLQMFAVEGPMAREVKDVRRALAAMSGADPRDPWWTPAPLSGPPLKKPIKVAVTVDPGGLGVHPDVADGVRKAAKALADAGYDVEEAEPPAVAEALELFVELIAAEMRTGMIQTMNQVASPDANTFLNNLLESIPESTVASYVQGLGRRNAIAQQWTLFADKYPLVLGPVSTQPPFPVGYDIKGPKETAAVVRSMRLTVAINVLGLPAATAPVGVANGLPQGVQVIGPMLREDLCLDATQAIEDALGVLTPIDPKA